MLTKQTYEAGVCTVQLCDEVGPVTILMLTIAKVGKNISSTQRRNSEEVGGHGR